MNELFDVRVVFARGGAEDFPAVDYHLIGSPPELLVIESSAKNGKKTVFPLENVLYYEATKR